MLSQKEDLKNSIARLRKLTNRAIEYVCELKIDGLSIALTYQNGQLVLGATVETERQEKT